MTDADLDRLEQLANRDGLPYEGYSLDLKSSLLQAIAEVRRLRAEKRDTYEACAKIADKASKECITNEGRWSADLIAAEIRKAAQ